MKTLYIKSFRNLKEIKWRALLIALIITAGISIHAGGFMSRDTILNTRDTYYKELNLADLEMEFTPASPDEIPQLEDFKNQTIILPRLVMPGTMETKSGELLQTLIIYIDTESIPEVNSLKLIEGNYLTSRESNVVVIERTLAEVHGYKIGDKITLNPYSFPQELTVGGIAISPEFVISTSDPTVLIPSKGSLGVIFASKKLIEEFFGYPLYNQILFKLKDTTPPAILKQKIKDKLSGLDIQRFVSKDEQFSFRFLNEDMKGFSIFIPSIVVVFVVIIALILLITMNRLVLSQSREIGVLMALGYTRGAIFLSYILTVLILSIAGSLVAIPGSIIIRDLFSNNYANIMGLPPLYRTFSLDYIVSGSALFTLITLFATSIPLYRALKMLPQELMRGEREEKFIQIPGWLNALTALIARGSSTRLFGIRNIFRRPKLAIATIIIISSAIALSTSFLISASSWENFARESFAREKWDAIIAFKTHLEPLDLRKIMSTEGIKNYEPLVGGYAGVELGGNDYDYMLVGIDPRSEIRHFNIVEGTPLSDENGYEILINKAWAQIPEVKPGEIVKVTTKKGRFNFKVAGIIADMTLGTAYVPINVARAVLGLENKTSAALAIFNNNDHSGIRKALFNHEMVTRVELKRNMETLVNSYMEQMKRLSYVALGVSIFIGVLFMLSSITMNIHERSGEYATLQTLGFFNHEIARTVITEILAEGIVAIFVSIPLSLIFSKYLNLKMSQAWLTIEMYINPQDFLIVMISSLLLLPVAGLPGLMQIFRQDIAISVRRRSFG